MSLFRRRLLQQEEEKYITLANQYIDTEIFGASDIKVETKAFVDNPYDITFIIFCEYDSKDRFSFLLNNNRLRTDYNSAMDYIDTVSLLTFISPTIIIKDRSKTYINGNLEKEQTPIVFQSSISKICIGSNNHIWRRHILYVYYFKIYKDDILILDLIPYNETDMIDRLTGKIYAAKT